MMVNPAAGDLGRAENQGELGEMNERGSIAVPNGIDFVPVCLSVFCHDKCPGKDYLIDRETSDCLAAIRSRG